MGNGEKYINKMFTEEGYNTLLMFTKSLVKEYLKKKDQDYPFNIGIVFGMPYFKDNYAMKFNNKSELEGRINGYLQLLCISKIEVEYNDATIIYELPKINGG